MDRGFILQPTYMIEQDRAVVHLFGVTDDGASFVIRDTRVRPSFFIRRGDVPRAEPILEAARAEADAAGNEPGAPGGPAEEGAFPRVGPRAWTTMDGDDAAEILVAVPPDVPPLRERLRGGGIECLEADLPFVTRYLCDRGVRGAFGIEGGFRKGRRVDRIYEDVRLVPAEFEPELGVLSLDIETDLKAERVRSFALFGNLPRGGRIAEVHYRRPDGASGGALPEEGGTGGFYFEHRSEPALLAALTRRVREIDPDILTGWNVIDFDLRVLEQAFSRCGVPFYLGRADLPCRVWARDDNWMTSRATVHGRVAVDGLDLLRGAFIRLDHYALDAAARELLGEGKTISGGDRGAEIERRYHEDLPAFLDYNLTDARLVIDILDARRLIPLAVRRTLLTGLPLDRVAASIAAFDFLYIGALHDRGVVAPSVGATTAAPPAAPDSPPTNGPGGTPAGPPVATPNEVPATDAVRDASPTAIGGYVLDSKPGIYSNVWVFDYQSLYPSIIRTFQIDPLGAAVARRDPGRPAVTAPNGVRFLRGEGILPEILEALMPRRLEAKRRGQQVESLAIKILMNSFYGVLASPRCRFYSTQVSNAITTFGQKILLWTKEQFEARGYEVIYGDTDSVFVVSGLSSSAEAERAAQKAAREVNEALQQYVREAYDMESHLLLEFERQYLRFFMPSLRHTASGSKKRYAGLVERGGTREIVFTGLESVRRDWTVLAKDFQRQLLQRVFSGESVDAFVQGFLEELREGERDGDLVYRKALRKPLAEYGKTTPPHVKAARLLPGRPGRLISYVMTTEGPQPVGHVSAPLDYDHYVEKQVRPIAESILQHVGRTFDEFLGRPDQLGLL